MPSEWKTAPSLPNFVLLLNFFVLPLHLAQYFTPARGPLCCKRTRTIRSRKMTENMDANESKPHRPWRSLCVFSILFFTFAAECALCLVIGHDILPFGSLFTSLPMVTFFFCFALHFSSLFFVVRRASLLLGVCVYVCVYALCNSMQL